MTKSLDNNHFFQGIWAFLWFPDTFEKGKVSINRRNNKILWIRKVSILVSYRQTDRQLLLYINHHHHHHRSYHHTWYTCEIFCSLISPCTRFCPLTQPAPRRSKSSLNIITMITMIKMITMMRRRRVTIMRTVMMGGLVDFEFTTWVVIVLLRKMLNLLANKDSSVKCSNSDLILWRNLTGPV